ncbi:FGGY-family carbohydrate kinase [Fictibacillus enclensis]|uniref:FGGY-family carbohydrate kinase n=1 Tax=Fictibacillus enclensis TaxID=1017270 RepID=UPI0025A25F7F|nr:FGGY-family carbohydrate kinase [Fictibacillus enclensis]MDM5340514.1 FGGY-family carbohydrate kinase [Fictibacillus enclensis]
MPKFILGIDNGGTVTKAGLFTLDGKELAVASRTTEMFMPSPGHTERNMHELWEANVQVIQDVLKQSGKDPAHIVGIATTGHGNGIYLVDENGEPVTNGIISTDSRAKDIISEWNEDGTADKVLSKTMQSLWAGQPAALLAWFKENQPEVLSQTRWVFMCKDYIRYKLTGKPHAEITDISGSSLFNIRERKYDEEILRTLGIEEVFTKLPPVKYSGEICGYVTEEAAQLTGLRAGTPVAGGLFDIDASAIATGITDEEKLCIVAGTWSINEYITKEPVVDKELFMTSIYCIPGYWLTLEGSPTSASNLEWFVKEYFNHEYEEAKKRKISVYQLCNEMVEKTQPTESNILFFPFLFGSNVHPNAKACFFGFNGWHTKADMLRALYEGVVFGHKIHVDKLLKYRSKPEIIRIAGGATRSEVWMQMFADILQTPIEVVEGTEQGTLGAAICAAVATGQYPSFTEAAQQMIKVGKTYTPNQECQAVYEEKYTYFNKVLGALEPIWQ